MKTKLTDGEILALLTTDIKSGVKYTDTKLAAERRRVNDYYNGKLPAPHHAGNSRYVSTDVFDTVESAKATLLETFSAHGDIVQFSPRGEDDVAQAREATAYTKHVIFDQNNGTELFGTMIHGSLTHRNSVAKVYWDKCIEEIDEDFEGLAEDEVDALLQDDDVELNELELDEDGLFYGTLIRRENHSQVRILPLPMEEFIVSPNIKDLETGFPITHRSEKTRDELKEEGFDPKKVKELPDAGDDDLAVDPERLNRFADVSDSTDLKDDDDKQKANRKHVIYETYAKIDADGSGTKLWKLIHSGNVILDKEQVLRHPFYSYSALPTAHRFWGENFAARVIPTQNAKTVLTRSILDHAVLANNPRYGVVKGALTNPRELLDNRIGGLVNVTRSDGIFPLPQAPLNPFVFQTIAMLDDDKEDVTGVSRLSQGLNKDAISNQNSQGMVEQLIGASMQRQKTMSRAFASQFLGPLYLEVYRLVVENEDRERIVEIAGSYTPVMPSAWARHRDVMIDLRLGYGERDNRVNDFIALGTMLGQDPQVGHLFGTEERYNLYKTIMETKGHRAVSMFLKDPSKAEPPKPDPMAAAELKAAEQAIELDARKQALAEQKHKDLMELEQMMADMKARFDTLEYTLKTHDDARKSRETDNRIEVAQAEIALAQEVEDKSPDVNTKTTAIISPNG